MLDTAGDRRGSGCSQTVSLPPACPCDSLKSSPFFVHSVWLRRVSPLLLPVCPHLRHPGGDSDLFLAMPQACCILTSRALLRVMLRALAALFGPIQGTCRTCSRDPCHPESQPPPRLPTHACKPGSQTRSASSAASEPPPYQQLASHHSSRVSMSTRPSRHGQRRRAPKHRAPPSAPRRGFLPHT